jgi:hypothetical protein
VAEMEGLEPADKKTDSHSVPRPRPPRLYLREHASPLNHPLIHARPWTTCRWTVPSGRGEARS